MERQITNKRKRVFSLQPNKNPKAVFARRYVSHLIPALKKIHLDKPPSQINEYSSSFQKTVKHEVDMALALSAQEFSWGHFLQHKLLLSSSPHHDEDPRIISTSSSSKNILEEGEGEMKKRLKELQKLLPGGEEMEMEEMLSEIGSYIVCLELQMTVLNSLVQD